MVKEYPKNSLDVLSKAYAEFMIRGTCLCRLDVLNALRNLQDHENLKQNCFKLLNLIKSNITDQVELSSEFYKIYKEISITAQLDTLLAAGGNNAPNEE